MKLNNYLVTAAILAFLFTTIEMKAQWLNGTNIFNTNSGYVGIGTGSSISAKLHVTAGGVLFSGTTGTTPVSGAGTRLMWIPAKAAFRAGLVNSTEWDDVNIGNQSIALGPWNIASGTQSVSIGSGNNASGGGSIAIGSSNSASGGGYILGSSNTITGGVAIGNSNNISQGFAIGIGTINTVSGSNSISIGNRNTSSGNYSFAMGHNSTANSADAISLGYYVTAGATNAHIIGSGVYSSGAIMANSISNSLMIGYNSNIPTLFVGGSAGLGTTGNVGIGNSTPAYTLDVSGTTAMTGFKLGSSTTAGYVLTTDINGNGTWQAPGTGTGPFSYSGNDIYNNNIGNVAIGKSTASYKLDVNGTAAMTGFKLGTTSTAGYILTTDANGNGTWQLPAAAGSGAWTFSGNDVYNINSGNIGIGLIPTLGPKLQVGGTVSMTALKVGTTSTIGQVLTAIDGLGNVAWTTPSNLWQTNGTIIYSTSGIAVGRNTVPSGYIAAFEGKVRTRGVRCDQDVWADDAFSNNYSLMPMDSLSQFIKQYSHLPGIPTTEEVKQNGVDMSTMNEQLLRKIEENTLYILQLKAENDALKNEVKEIKALINRN